MDPTQNGGWQTSVVNDPGGWQGATSIQSDPLGARWNNFKNSPVTPQAMQQFAKAFNMPQQLQMSPANAQTFISPFAQQPIQQPMQPQNPMMRPIGYSGY